MLASAKVQIKKLLVSFFIIPPAYFDLKTILTNASFDFLMHGISGTRILKCYL